MATESSTTPERSNTRILIGNHFADIIINREHQTPIYYWIAQQLGSADVVGWGQEDTFDKAEQSAGQFLEERNRFTRSLATSASD
ncbi:MAG TPA: hypothetical protein VJT08_16210 [Terriglobales bacterium]|jgi:hypothetical protein|nr:hypothetical protein [Terriglobales bacterium]